MQLWAMFSMLLTGASYRQNEYTVSYPQSVSGNGPQIRSLANINAHRTVPSDEAWKIDHVASLPCLKLTRIAAPCSAVQRQQGTKAQLKVQQQMCPSAWLAVGG